MHYEDVKNTEEAARSLGFEEGVAWLRKEMRKLLSRRSEFYRERNMLDHARACEELHGCGLMLVPGETERLDPREEKSDTNALGG